MYVLLDVGAPGTNIPTSRHDDLQTAGLAWCMGVLDYLFLLSRGHRVQIEDVQKDDDVVRAVFEQVESRHHWLKEHEAHPLGDWPGIVMLKQAQHGSLLPLRHLHSNHAALQVAPWPNSNVQDAVCNARNQQAQQARRHAVRRT